MTVLGRLTRSTIENPQVPLSSANIAEFLDWGLKTDAGISVSEVTALGSSAVWRSTTLISGTCASLPLKTYRKGTKDRVVVRLLDNPHPDKTPFELWEYAYTSVALWGNSYQRKVRNPSGVVQWLDPLPPGSVRVGRVKADDYTPDGKIFEVTQNDGTKEPLTSFDILHIPGFGYDGVCGVSPVRMARTSISLSLAAEKHGARFFGSGSLMSGILQTEQRLDDAEATALKQRWKDTVTGIGKSNEIAVLGAGAKFQPVSMTNTDAQFIDSRRFQIEEWSRWCGLPIHILGSMEKSTTWGTGIESMTLGMVKFTLNPLWLTRFEQRITKEATPTGIYAEYDRRGILEGDSAARSAYYASMWNMGVMSINEIRVAENLSPIPDGDAHFVPMNFNELGAPAVPDGLSEIITDPNAVPAGGI